MRVNAKIMKIGPLTTLAGKHHGKTMEMSGIPTATKMSGIPPAKKMKALLVDKMKALPAERRVLLAEKRKP